jgi:hypothetical protein
MSILSIFSQIGKILKKPHPRKKNLYGYNLAPRQEVGVFFHSLYIRLEIKTASDLQKKKFWAPEFFLQGFLRFWHLAHFTEK